MKTLYRIYAAIIFFVALGCFLTFVVSMFSPKYERWIIPATFGGFIFFGGLFIAMLDNEN